MTLFGNAAMGLDLYHVGIVVPSMEEALETFGDAFGFRWTDISESTLAVVAGGDPCTARIRACYSVDGPPYLELIEDVAGDIWGETAFGLNHTGFWADDIVATRDRLEHSGLPALVFDAGEVPPRFTYHRAANGTWIELVGPGFRPRLLEKVKAAQDRLAAAGS